MSNTALKLLVDIGFSEKEGKIYVSLLSMESATANEIAKKADINRTTCYDLLETLIKRGVVSKFSKRSRTYYRVGDPKRLITYLEHEKNDFERIVEKKKENIQRILPELVSLQRPLSTQLKVQFFEGEKGMREAYEDTLTAKGGILAYANVETMHEGLPNFFPEYYIREGQRQKCRSKLSYLEILFPLKELSEIVMRSARVNFYQKARKRLLQKLISTITKCSWHPGRKK